MTRIIPNDSDIGGVIPVEAVYGAPHRYGDRFLVGPCRCGYGFLARHDSGLCEWCTAGLPPGRIYRNYTGWLPRPPAKGPGATYIRDRTGFTADPG